VNSSLAFRLIALGWAKRRRCGSQGRRLQTKHGWDATNCSWALSCSRLRVLHSKSLEARGARTCNLGSIIIAFASFLMIMLTRIWRELNQRRVTLEEFHRSFCCESGTRWEASRFWRTSLTRARGKKSGNRLISRRYESKLNAEFDL
jgi:hypothetical protein